MLAVFLVAVVGDCSGNLVLLVGGRVVDTLVEGMDDDQMVVVVESSLDTYHNNK